MQYDTVRRRMIQRGQVKHGLRETFPLAYLLYLSWYVGIVDTFCQSSISSPFLNGSQIN